MLLISEVTTEIMLFLIYSFILLSFVEVFPETSIYEGKRLKVTTADVQHLYLVLMFARRWRPPPHQPQQVNPPHHKNGSKNPV